MSSARPRGYSIKLFLPNGNPDGLRVISKSHWTGEGLVCPRTLLPGLLRRREVERMGVYILINDPEVDGLPTLYVGEGQVKERLKDHDQKKLFWTRVVFFTTKDGSLNSAHTRYLEAHLIAEAAKARRADVTNIQRPEPPALPEAERVDMESFLADILTILPLVGVREFEQPRAPAATEIILTLTAKGCSARGYEADSGFVVLEGSRARTDEVPSIHAFMSTLRRELLERGVLLREREHLAFTQDYEFSSPSTAAGVVAGRASNGREEWKDADGRTLKEIQVAALDEAAP